MEKNTVNNINQIIKELGSIDLAKIEIKELEKMISFLMNGYNTRLMKVPAKLVYRARKKETKRFENIEKLIYPKPEFIKTYGRVNYPFNSVFYGSANESTAIIENQPKEGDEFTVLLSGLNKDYLTMMELGMRHTAWKSKGKISDDIAIRRKLGNEQNILKNQLIDDFLIDQFTQPVKQGEEDKYKLTAVIGSNFLKGEKIEGLVFPSIAADKNTSNIVIKPEVYDNFYVPKECWTILIEKKIERNKYQVLCTAKAKRIELNGDIIW
ncbi:MAG: hypothetical protein A2W98_08515 [Bacteroidetes bacterium GWF2_33_38]|nr:MAG: hypothetical protein A2W98_08515 [Bacteroidetes bacterium GWF2_33_38]